MVKKFQLETDEERRKKEEEILKSQPILKQTLTTLPIPPDIPELRRTFEQEQQKQQTEIPQIPEPKFTEPRIIRNQDTGEISGVIFPDGKSFIGKPSPQHERDIRGLTEEFIQKRILPEGAIEESETQRRIKQVQTSQMALDLFEQFRGKPLPQSIINNLKPSDIDEYEALASAISPSALIGAGGGVLAKGGAAAIGISAGTAIGIGLAGGLLSGVKSNIKSQLAENIAGKKIELKEGEQNLNNILTAINHGDNPFVNVELFYQNVAAIQESHAQLKLDTQRNLAKFSGETGKPELTRYKIFFDRILPNLERELQIAIINPNPNKIFVTPEILEQ